MGWDILRGYDWTVAYSKLIFFYFNQFSVVVTEWALIPSSTPAFNDRKIIFLFHISRRDDVPILHQNRTDSVRKIERWIDLHKSIFCDATFEIRIGDIWGIGNAGHIFQLRIVTVDGQIYRETEVSVRQIFFLLSRFEIETFDSSSSFGHFATNVCAIVGGIFTVAGIIDSIFHHSIYLIKKKIELGKLS